MWQMQTPSPAQLQFSPQQILPHGSRPSAQTHFPAWHDCPSAVMQALPQSPQKSASLRTSRQRRPQQRRPPQQRPRRPPHGWSFRPQVASPAAIRASMPARPSPASVPRLARRDAGSAKKRLKH
jgi:hypothetical protein